MSAGRESSELQEIRWRSPAGPAGSAEAKDPKITRGEALRQAMLALIDSDGFKDDAGKTLFSYAHPLFWAPYSIIGDGGAQ